MSFEIVLLLAGIVAAAAFVAKVYEWRQDVLYGPYIQPTELARLHPRDQSQEMHRSAASFTSVTC